MLHGESTGETYVSRASATTLDDIPLLDALSEDERRDLEGRCHWRRYRSGEQILDKDSDDRDVYFVVAGAVQIVNFSMTGREIAFAQLDAGSYFGELSAIDGNPRSATVLAATDCQLAAMPASLFTELVVAHPAMASHVLERLTAIIRSCDERIMDLSTLGAVQRVYLQILRIAEENQPAEPGEAWRISPVPTQKAIASLASTTRETVARSMSQLVAAGIIEREGNTVLVHDFDRLEALAGALDSDIGGLSR